jgi:flagellar basal body-associated protein FliL
VLRSIRRKDAPESIMRAIEEDEGEKEQQQEKTNTIKKIVEVVLIVITLGACCLLAYSLASSTGLLPKASTVEVKTAATNGEWTLSEVGEWVGVSSKEAHEALIRAFV